MISRITLYNLRFHAHGRKENIPYPVYNTLHVAVPACYGYYSILLRHDDTELAKSSVPTVRVMAASPELVAITLRPVAADCTRTAVIIADLLGGCGGDPFFGQQPLVIPHTLLQIELSECCNIFGSDT
ncbi:hypothetical protein D3C73_960700 [compost metagenome]